MVVEKYLSLEEIPDSNLLKTHTHLSLHSEPKSSADLFVPMELLEGMLDGNFAWKLNLDFENATNDINNKVRFYQSLLTSDLIKQVEEMAAERWKSNAQTFTDFIQAYHIETSSLLLRIATVNTKEEQSDWVQDLQRRLSPDFIAMDLNVMWSFSNFEHEYESFLEDFFVRGYLRSKEAYCLNPIFLEQVSSIINYRLVKLLSVLKKYKLIFMECQLQLTDLNKLEVDEFRLAAASMIRESSLVKSCSDVVKTIEKEQVVLEELMNTIYQWAYSSFTVSLVKNFTMQGKQIEAISLKNTDIDYCYEEDELKKIELFLYERFTAVENELLIKNWQGARSLLNPVKLLTNNKKLKGLTGKPGKSIEYSYELYLFAASAGEIMDKSGKEFIDGAKVICERQSLMLNDADLLALNVLTQFQLAARFIHCAVKVGEEKKLLSLFDLLVETIERFENGELLTEELLFGNDEFYLLNVLTAFFLQEKFNHPFIDICKQSHLTLEVLEQKVLSDYKKVTGSDEFYRFFTKSVFEKVGKDMLRTVMNVFKE